MCLNWIHLVQKDDDIHIFVKCNWVNTRWQWYSTHLHTNNTWNNINNNRTTQITTVQHNNKITAQITTEQHNYN